MNKTVVEKKRCDLYLLDGEKLEYRCRWGGFEIITS
jgi:hypothetical protein